MSTGDPVCSMCGLGGNGHADNCPRRFGPVLYTEQYPVEYKAQHYTEQYPNVQPHKGDLERVTTAYERDQQALRDRVTVLEQRAKKLEAREIRDDARMDNALRRIEQLELAAAVCPGGRDTKPAMVVSGDKFYTLESAATHLRLARECVDQCKSLGFKWACLLDELVVARWMVDNPDECRGAFDLQRLKKSIKL